MFLIIDMATGVYDGWYRHRQDADEVRERLADTQGGQWVVLSHDGDDAPYIPQCAVNRRRASLYEVRH